MVACWVLAYCLIWRRYADSWVLTEEGLAIFLDVFLVCFIPIFGLGLLYMLTCWLEKRSVKQYVEVPQN